MFLRQILIETRKTLAHPALWLGLGGLSLLLVGFVLVEHLQIVNGHQSVSGGLEQDLIDGLAFWGWIGTLAYAISTAVIMAFDYPDRSIQTWLTRGLPRPVLMAARLVVVLLFNLILIGYVVLAILGLAALSRLFFFGRVDMLQMNWAALLPATLRMFWASLPYLALTVFLAIFSRSPLFSAAGTVVYASVLEMLLGNLANRFPALVRYLPAQLAGVLKGQTLNLSLVTLPHESAMPELRAILLIGLMFLALSGAATLIFSRQDLGG